MQAPGEEADPRIHWGEMDNGLRFAVLPTSRMGREVSLRLILDIGSAEDSKARLGLSRLLAKMTLRGARRFQGNSLPYFLKSRGMDPFAAWNVETDLRHTVFRLDFTRIKVGDLATGARYLSDVLGGLEFDATALEEERSSLLNEIENNLSYRERESLIEELMFENSPYSSIYAEDLKAGIEATTIEDLQSYWNGWYRPERAVLFITGDLDTEATIELIQSEFGGIEKAGATLETSRRSSGKIRSSMEVRTHYGNDLNSYVSLIRVGEEKDLYNASHEREVRLLDIFAQYVQSRIDKKTMPRPGLLRMGHGRHLLALSKSGNVQDLPNIMFAVDQIIFQLSEEGIPEVHFADFKDSSRKLIGSSSQASSAQERPSIVAERFVSDLKARSPFRSGDRLRSHLESLLEELDREMAESLVKEYLDVSSMHYLVTMPVGPEASAKKLAKRLKSMRKTYSTSWVDSLERDSDWIVKERLGESGLVVSSDRFNIGEYRVNRYVFENSFRLNVVKTDNAPGGFQAKLSLGNGLTALGEPFPGALYLARPLLQNSTMGEGPYPSLYNELLASGLIGVDAGASVGEVYWRAAGDSKEDLRDFMSLIGEWLLIRDIRESDFDKALEQMLSIAGAAGSEPVLVKMDRLSRGDEARLRTLYTKEEVENIEFSYVQEWLESAAESGYAELTVVGDVKPQVVLGVARKTMGAVPKRVGKIVQPRHGEPVRYPEPGIVLEPVDSRDDVTRMTYSWPMIGEYDCEQETLQIALMEAFELELKLLLREQNLHPLRLHVSMMGDSMIPGSSGIALKLDCHYSDTEVMRETVERFSEQLSSALTVEVIRAAEGAAEASLHRARTNDSSILSIVSQSQGRSRALDCFQTQATERMSFDVRRYADYAQALFSPDNLRAVILTPEG